jgi:DNA-binding response OmpR family regulator
MTGSRGTILIIEDFEDTAELLKAVVEEEGFSASISGDAEKGLAEFENSQPVAVFLDWVLPDSSGIEVCRQLRLENPLLPIVFISGRDDETSISRGLDAGADDFVVKPFKRGELVARLEAHLRKVASIKANTFGDPVVSANGTEHRVLKFGDVEVDLAAREVRSGGEEVVLGPLEFGLLEYLCRNAGVAVSREQILTEVYGYNPDISTERVDLLVRRLRSKLGEGPRRGGALVAVPGYGYRLERRLSERPEPAE